MKGQSVGAYQSIVLKFKKFQGNNYVRNKWVWLVLMIVILNLVHYLQW